MNFKKQIAHEIGGTQAGYRPLLWNSFKYTKEILKKPDSRISSSCLFFLHVIHSYTTFSHVNECRHTRGQNIFRLPKCKSGRCHSSYSQNFSHTFPQKFPKTCQNGLSLLRVSYKVFLWFSTLKKLKNKTYIVSVNFVFLFGRNYQLCMGYISFLMYNY